MKKICITLSLALCCMLIASCNKQASEDEAKGASSEENATVLKIAYVEIDSLMVNYQLCKDLSEIGNMEAENIRKTLESKQRALEQHYNSMQQKYESNGFTSQEELQRAQSSLQKEQQDLEELNLRLTNSFQEQQIAYNEEMRDSIQKFLKSYNKNKKFDFILSKAGDNILFANAKYDITNEVLKGLNKRYKVKAEVKEKLKQKQSTSDK